MFLIFVEVVFLIALSPMTSEVLAPVMTDSFVELHVFVLSTSVYFLVMAILHVVHGMCVNVFGSVTTGLYGTMVYTIASGALIRTTTPGAFLVFRAMQSVGASACTVVGFVRTREKLIPTRDVPYSNACRSALLIVAPMMSQGLFELGGWCMPFLVLACYGGVSFGLIVVNARRRTPPPTQSTVLATNNNSTGTSFAHLALWGVCDSSGFATMLLWVVYAPVVSYTQHFGVWYGLTFVGSAVGHLSVRWSHGHPSRKLPLANGVMLVCVSVAWRWTSEWWIVYACMTVLNFARAGAASLCQTHIMLTGSRSSVTAAVFHSSRMVATAAAVFLSRRRPWVGMMSCVTVTFMSAIVIFLSNRQGPHTNENVTTTSEMVHCGADTPLPSRVCILLQSDAHDGQKRTHDTRVDRPLRTGTKDGFRPVGFDGGGTAHAFGHRDSCT